MGLNHRPPPCQGGALPLSYAPIVIETTTTCAFMQESARYMPRAFGLSSKTIEYILVFTECLNNYTISHQTV